MKTPRCILYLPTCAVLLFIFSQCKPPAPCSVPIVPPELRWDFQHKNVDTAKVCTDQFGNPIEKDNLIIHFPDGMTDAQIQSVRDSVMPDVIDSCLCDPRLQNWKWNDASGIHIEETVSQLTTQSKKEGTGFTASLNYLVQGFDPDRGQGRRSDVKLVDSLQYPKHGKLIAILDTGLDPYHTQSGGLSLYKETGNACGPIGSRGWNFIEENDRIFDDNGHGTAVTGVIAETLQKAAMNNEYSCGATFMILKTLNKRGVGNLFDNMCAIQYAVAAEAEVINISWGFYNVDNDFFRDSILTLLTPSRRHPLFVTSMGNYGQRNVGEYRHFPSDYSMRYEYVIGTAGDIRDQAWGSMAATSAAPYVLYDSSNYRSPALMVTAPAVDVQVWGRPSIPGEPRRRLADGTSYSAASITAESAIAMCCDPMLRSPQVSSQLRRAPSRNMIHHSHSIKVSYLVLEQGRLCKPVKSPEGS